MLQNLSKWIINYKIFFCPTSFHSVSFNHRFCEILFRGKGQRHKSQEEKKQWLFHFWNIKNWFFLQLTIRPLSMVEYQKIFKYSYILAFTRYKYRLNIIFLPKYTVWFVFHVRLSYFEVCVPNAKQYIIGCINYDIE